MVLNEINNNLINFNIKKGKKNNNIKYYNKLLCLIKKNKNFKNKKLEIIIKDSIKKLFLPIYLKNENIINNNSFFLLNNKKQLKLALNWLLCNNQNKNIVKEILNIYNHQINENLLNSKIKNYEKIQKLRYLIR